MGLRMKFFYFVVVHWNIWFLGGRGGAWKTSIEGGIAWKGGLGQFADLRGLGKKDGVVFLKGGWYPNAHYVIVALLCQHNYQLCKLHQAVLTEEPQALQEGYKTQL